MADNTKQQATYVSDAVLRETFADNVHSVGFDGANLRVELAVTRVEQSGPDRRATTRHPAVRLVLPLSAVNELMHKIGKALADLENQGVLRKGGGPQQLGGPGQPN